MEESSLIKISLIGAVSGLFVLLLISGHIISNDTTVKKIDGSYDRTDKSITYTGKIVSLKNLDKSTMLTLEYSSKKNALIFEKNVDIDVNESVEMTGREDEEMFIVDSIKVID